MCLKGLSVFWEPVAGQTIMMGSCEPEVRLLCIVGKTMNKDILGHCVHFGTSLSSKADWKMMCGWFLMCNKQSSVFRLASVFKHFILKHDVDFNYIKISFQHFPVKFSIFLFFFFFYLNLELCVRKLPFLQFHFNNEIWWHQYKKNAAGVFYSKVDKNI